MKSCFDCNFFTILSTPVFDFLYEFSIVHPFLQLQRFYYWTLKSTTSTIAKNLVVVLQNYLYQVEVRILVITE